MTSTKYEVVFKKSALKELQTVPDRMQQRILEAVQLLALNPHTELLHIKKMKGAESLYRFRLGDYRVIYSIESVYVKIIVIKIGHRKDVYE